jgi:oxygen-independent coproporphyrinogen-3 oxidase
MRPDLVARYSEERLPRYTSYPTAPHFNASVDGARYVEWLGTLSAETLGSLYVHVPFCRRMCWYCGCNTAVSLRDEPVLAYAKTLRAEIGLVGSTLGRRLPVVHIHFGGGTPTILPVGAFLRLMEGLRETFDFREDAEIAIEIDPRTLTPAMAKALGEAGVNRASLGVQSLDPTVQAAIGRVQSFAETAEAIERLRAAGISGINVDLIYGLPHQTVASCLETVAECLTLRPDRFAVFGYAHVPAFKKHQRRIDEAALPGGPARNAQAEAIADRLEQAGYRPIGLDHYALPDDPMAIAQTRGHLHRNFQGYTTDPASALIGLGASAIGRLPQGYVQNEPTVRAYGAAIGAGRLATCKGFTLGPEDRLRGDLIERLMCDFRVDIDAVCRSHNQPADRVANAVAAIDRLVADGVVRREGSVIELEPDARGLVRAVAASFDAYLAQSTRSHSPAL